MSEGFELFFGIHKYSQMQDEKVEHTIPMHDANCHPVILAYEMAMTKVKPNLAGKMHCHF